MISSLRDLVELTLAYVQQQQPTLSLRVPGTYPTNIFRRFSGSFEPIFDPNGGGNIDSSIWPPPFGSKIGSKEPENQLKLISGIGSEQPAICAPPIQEKPPPLLEKAEPAPKIPDPTPVKQPQIDLRTLLQKIAPALLLIDPPPDDQIARDIASSWKIALPEIQVLLLALSPLPEELNFLKRLAKAIDEAHFSTKILSGERLEREKQWESLFSKNTFRLILTSPHLEKHPELLKYYTAIPAQKTALLHKVPCIPLQPASVYKQDKKAKALLWKEILQTLSAHVC